MPTSLYLVSLGIPPIVLFICLHFHISYRVTVLAGIALLLSTPVALAFGSENAANFIAILAYYLLLVGLALAIAKYRREQTAGLDSSEGI